ncbi:YrzI family small protein [Shouchella lonarensis]|uniref:Sporulation protein (Bac_small_yrzI) n=1 Tax=Shouchella lonarensis TaxID=1464122 RepID=A0A1G6JS24_9BACI|nr:YrzI family small protein [Shouchella lonarensis]SDC21503.1 tandem small hypothetical protein [Shouchella lonarensis]
MTFSFIFFTVTIKKRSYSSEELELFVQEEKMAQEQEAVRNKYTHFHW